ncbi:FAD-dependent oxidoreductase [Mycobacterium sp. 360MFTsu5.1]|uniref:FAD-dependent oxidoreductase n=1 Tax=Mycobacterium sp. 360MFTsu5.1 TaxID=1172186 RepID=UPI000361DFE7|nr:FAD-dependent oxidoreductase [Mycobacterium sp. 360MFTsu5.1]
MAYVITQNCCKDASCIPVCPVDCIRPAPSGGGFDAAEMLYIDPDSCIDCGACFDECPVDAIHYDDDLPPHLERFKQLSADYFALHPLQADPTPEPARHSPVRPGALRVAVVGAGPAACYAAAELIGTDGVEIDMFERLPTPFGLIRAGVAPDHQRTKSVVRLFDSVLANDRVSCHFNVEVERDVTHDELLASHHAVIYAVGASDTRALGLPGEDLAGSHPAADFVGWYNGHPDHSSHHFELTGRRAVVIGNGNVALDVARVLTMGPVELAGTDIAEHALDALHASSIDEVVILARRGLADAAFSVSEFLALGHLPDVDVVIEGDPIDEDAAVDFDSANKIAIAREYAACPITPGHKRIVFRFGARPVEIVGSQHVTALVLDDGEVLETSLLLRSIGYRGIPIDGVPFDPARGVVPNNQGRVVDDSDAPVPGVYVTGWIKRGPRGVIGSNRVCAAETVASLWDDFDSGTLGRDVLQRDVLRSLLTERGVIRLDWDGWRAIDASECERGRAAGRHRSKLVSRHELIAAALARD